LEEIKDKTEDNKLVITMEGGRSRQLGSTKPTQWLLDSGATVHVTNDSDALLRARKSNEQVRVGNGEDAKAERIGDVEMIVGKDETFLLKDVFYVPGFFKNVVSLTKIVNNGITVQLERSCQLWNEWKDFKSEQASKGRHVVYQIDDKNAE
jgi:hypothetical protein